MTTSAPELFAVDVPVEAVEDGQLIRPHGWSHFYEVLTVEHPEPGWVKVLWFVGSDRRMPRPWPPDAYTMFEVGEIVAATR